MGDVHDTATRSRNMAAIRSHNTKPEIAVRRIIHALGFRFRLRSALPGRPDLVLPRHRKVVFVHGCFWHMHDCRYGRVTPATRPEFWSDKRHKNVERDRRVIDEIITNGWTPLVIWECWLRDSELLTQKLQRFLLVDATSGDKVAGRRASRRR